ncbi:MAG: hypothetical protein ACTSPY_09740 [Candidatus Helarchaeota archaeon]
MSKDISVIMNSKWHIIMSIISTTILWVFSFALDLAKVQPVLIALTPIVILSAAYYPDLDQKIEKLKHRSSLTHSALIGLILLVPFFWPNEAAILLNQFCYNIGVHLLCDLKTPEKMKGFATVKSPRKEHKVGDRIIRDEKKITMAKRSITWLILNGAILIIVSIFLLYSSRYLF